MPHTETDCRHCGGTGKALDQQATASHMLKLRRDSGLSLQGVSDLILRLHGEGYTTGYLSKLENGKKPWSPRLVRRWEGACGVAESRESGRVG